MRRFVWKPEKNNWLKKQRNLSFEQIEEAIASGELKGMLTNRTHPEQIILAVAIDDNIVAVPATVERTVVILRTAYVSRQLNKRYGR